MKVLKQKYGFGKMVLQIAVILLFLHTGPPGVNPVHAQIIAETSGIICPDDIETVNDPGHCYAVVYYTAPANAYLLSGLASGSDFPVGVTVITYKSNVGSHTCSFTVTVIDSEPPEIFCPGNIIIPNSVDECQVVYFDPPYVFDNCGAVDFWLVSGLESGSIFPAGTTVNEYMAVDETGNWSTCSFTVTISGNSSTVLYYDGSTSQLIAPQGGVAYQRSFYLISPEEMMVSDLSNGIEINSIGFTTGVAQEKAVNGVLKVYLQNTADEVSRFDTAWTVATTSENHYTLSDLIEGDYEWQVRAVCSGNSPYSALMDFSTFDISECGQPYNLETINITDASATFTWEAPPSNDFEQFFVEYSPYPFATWTQDSTTNTFYQVTGLHHDTAYRWSVKSSCQGKESRKSEGSFSTERPHACNNPTGLTVSNIGDTLASFSWIRVEDAENYKLYYRRVGTTNWFSAISMDSSITIMGLASGLAGGTTYEWRLQTICKDGDGTKVSGPDFTTTGAAVCYPPEGLKTTGIGVTGATLRWLETPGADSYQVRYRLKESITWENVIEPMTLVSDGSLTLPTQIGGYDIPFESGEFFVYEGNGIYVALEFSNPSGELSSIFNTVLSTKQNTSVKDIHGLDSLKLIMAFDGRNHSGSNSFPASLRASDARPETRFGSPSFNDMVEVTALYTLGKVALPYGSPVPVSAVVRNFTADPLVLPVTLKVFSLETGNLRHSETVETEVPANCRELVIFSDWTPYETGVDSIVVSIPVQSGENVTFNNSQHFNQLVNRVIHSYDDDTPALTGAGFGENEGLILSRFSMNGCGTVNSLRVYLHWSAQDFQLYAVVMDEDGVILDTSPAFSPDSSEINNYQTFFFQNPQLITGSDYYVGIVQQAVSGKSYYPVGVQWESSIIRDGAYFRADLDGSNLIGYPYPGRLMMQVEVLPAMPVPFISGDEILCEGSSITLQAASKTVRYASKVIAVSSEQTPTKYGAIQVLGSPDVYPEYTSSPNAWMSLTTNIDREFLVLHFPNAAPINFIDIYQVLNPGAVDMVRVKDDMGEYHIVYAEKAKAEPEVASIKKIRFPTTSYPVSEIRIDLASDSISGFNLIDAVAIGEINDPDDVFDNYTWYPGGQTSQSIVVNTPGKYFLTVTNPDNCVLTDSISVYTPETIIPTISLSGPPAFCDGGSVVLKSSQLLNNTWSTGETTDSIIVKTSGSYSVTYFDGCDSLASAPVEITVFALPEPNISGGPICPGSFTVLDAGAGYQSYLWSTGDTTQTIEVNIQGNYSVTVVDNNGCTGSGNIQAFRVPDPTPTISGNPFFCPGDSAYLDAGEGYASYLWSTGATTRFVYIKTVGLVSVTVTDIYGCQGTSSITTGEYVPPQPVISGTLSLCAGASTVLDVGPGYAAFEWSTGATTRAIVVREGTYTVTVTDGNGCKGSTSVVVDSLGSLPEVPGPITGPTEGLCNQSEVIYSVSALPNTTHYVWTVPEGMTITEGQGTTSITVAVSLFSSGFISVAASNKCGQSPTWNGRTLLVKGSPAAPEYIAGQADGVCGLSSVVYSTIEVFGATSYSWTVPEGATLISGNGTSSILVSFSSSFVAGDVCVSAVNDCGESEFKCLTVNGPPAMPAQIFGPIQVCRRDKKVNYWINPIANASSYVWAVPHQASIFSGQGTTSILVDFGNWSGNISVFAQNSCGNSSIKYLAVDVINCNPKGITATTDPHGNNIHLDPNMLSDNFFAFYPEVVGSSGGGSDEYPGFLNWTLGEAVIETIMDGASILSQGFQQSHYQLFLSDNTLEENSFFVEVYPVPTLDVVLVRVRSMSETANLIIELYDLVGNGIFREETRGIDSNYQINLSHYPPGIFILKVVDVQNHQQRFIKVIKI